MLDNALCSNIFIATKDWQAVCFVCTLAERKIINPFESEVIHMSDMQLLLILLIIIVLKQK